MTEVNEWPNMHEKSDLGHEYPPKSFRTQLPWLFVPETLSFGSLDSGAIPKTLHPGSLN